jgi:hypothetical protein
VSVWPEVIMRVRAVVAIGLLLLPASASAQRVPLPRIGGAHPGQPVPLSPQPGAIARAIAYRRLNLSVESYPLISYVEAPGLASYGHSAWTSLGAGTRASYRLTPHVAATMDLTSSLLGSPLTVQTAEIGARLGPERSERRLYPFLDIRAGYVAAYNSSLGSLVNDPFYPAPSGTYAIRYSYGFGGVAGVGMEYALTNTFSLTSGATVLRSHMTSHDFTGTSAVVPSFALTSYRLMLGLKYNPVRMFIP